MRPLLTRVPSLVCLIMFLLARQANAMDIPAAPLEPALEKSQGKSINPGAILEFWFAPKDRKFERFPMDPSVTGMFDGAEKVFAGSSMLQDAEMKQFVARHGVLQWTTYFQAKKAGKHVFVLGIEGMWSDNPRYGGASMLVNDEEKVVAIPGRDESVTVEFAGPGLYKMQIRMWWTHGSRQGPMFQDYRVNLKVREPGSLGLRQVTKKDLFYLLPE